MEPDLDVSHTACQEGGLGTGNCSLRCSACAFLFFLISEGNHYCNVLHRWVVDSLLLTCTAQSSTSCMTELLMQLQSWKLSQQLLKEALIFAYVGGQNESHNNSFYLKIYQSVCAVSRGFLSICKHRMLCKKNHKYPLWTSFVNTGPSSSMSSTPEFP